MKRWSSLGKTPRRHPRLSFSPCLFDLWKPTGWVCLPPVCCCTGFYLPFLKKTLLPSAPPPPDRISLCTTADPSCRIPAFWVCFLSTCMFYHSKRRKTTSRGRGRSKFWWRNFWSRRPCWRRTRRLVFIFACPPSCLHHEPEGKQIPPSPPPPDTSPQD